MNPLWGHVIGAVIVVLMLAFLGIWAWAWLPYHRDTFAKLAQVPMNDPLDASASVIAEDARQ
jgi:cytochrome c oxidase cbb3-type subunit 4